MITTNVLKRTFDVSFGNSTGTAFSIDKDSGQYLVTARLIDKNPIGFPLPVGQGI